MMKIWADIHVPILQMRNIGDSRTQRQMASLCPFSRQGGVGSRGSKVGQGRPENQEQDQPSILKIRLGHGGTGCWRRQKQVQTIS